MKRKALGKGLRSLIPETPPPAKAPKRETPAPRQGLREIDLDRIRPNRGQPREQFDPALLEELARVYGYNRLPVTHINANLVIPAKPEKNLALRDVRSHLAARGYNEAITYSFVDPKLQTLFDPSLAPVELSNPISADMAVMRTSLVPGLVTALSRNTKRQQPRVRMFETGLRFLPSTEGLKQVPTLAMVITGDRFEEAWSLSSDGVDFFDLKGDLESVLELTRAAESFRFVAGPRDALHPGQTAAIYKDEQEVGYIGCLLYTSPSPRD